MPVVSPLLILLKQSKSVVDKGVRHQELMELHKLCGVINRQVINKYHDTFPGFDRSLQHKCIEGMNEVPEYCG